jgi:hypothetical protein
MDRPEVVRFGDLSRFAATVFASTCLVVTSSSSKSVTGHSPALARCLTSYLGESSALGSRPRNFQPVLLNSSQLNSGLNEVESVIPTVRQLRNPRPEPHSPAARRPEQFPLAR